MEGIHTDLAPAEFWKPGNIVECTFCCDSGHLMSEACEADPRGGRIRKRFILPRCGALRGDAPQVILARIQRRKEDDQRAKEDQQHAPPFFHPWTHKIYIPPRVVCAMFSLYIRLFCDTIIY